MTHIWTETGFIDNDPYVIETEEAAAGEGQRPVLALEAFLARIEESNEADLAVLIQPGDDAGRIAPYLDRVAVVAVAFPAFNDGRGFSHASLLRQRSGFAGDLRAVGHVLIDQIPLMLRCGFSSFAVSDPVALRRLAEGRLPGIDHHYQPAARPARQPGKYAWRRLS